MRLFVAVIAALAVAPAAAAFTPTDPFFPRQWYLPQVHAFDAWPDAPPTLTPVRVAVIDSGIDASHPEFAGRIAAGRSFVGGDWRVDAQGHGTFVAGEIAAAMDGQGVVGVDYSAELLVAKVVRADGTIPLAAEAAAIRWAADRGARVINLSLGGVRDPLRPSRDTYSKLEADAVAYAYSKGAVLVAAVGNADEAFATPWPFASYPAALPHVIGVSAINRLGGVPAFSNRDPIYNDMAAPGTEIVSTFPRDLTALRPTCTEQGYSTCASDDYRRAEGTSFAAPQVSGAAALLFALDPKLRAEQVVTILERTTDDVNVTTGCRICPFQRDAYTGWGRLDVAKAVAALGAPLPAADRYESNDDAGTSAYTVYGRTGELKASIDFWDDQIDVYRIKLTRAQALTASLVGPQATNLNLVLWKPGTQRVEDLRTQRLRAAQAVRPGSTERMTYRTKASGWYYLEVKITTPGAGAYALSFSKS